ncbi:MAG: hypothetical protein ACRDVZ_11560 [Jiangellaceae bacterium]
MQHPYPPARIHLCEQLARPSDAGHTFFTFVRTIGAWWPIRPLGPPLTRVSVEHRGWEALSEEQLAAECRIPGGGYLGGTFDRGWELVLTRLAEAVEGVDPART